LVASSVPYHAGTREGLRSYLICFDLEWASGLRVTLSMSLSLSPLLLDSAEISKKMQFPIKFASVKIDFFQFSFSSCVTTKRLETDQRIITHIGLGL
jgi:hypothetical protein